MTPSPMKRIEERPEGMVPRHNNRVFAEALFSLSQTQRRLAHRYRREAFEWQARGNVNFYADCMAKGSRLWREAKTNLAWAKRTKLIEGARS